MTSHKQSLPSFASIASVLSIVLYCAGFLRVEFELREHKKRINAIESVVRGQPPTSGPNLQTTKNVPGKFVSLHPLSKSYRYRHVLRGWMYLSSGIFGLKILLTFQKRYLGTAFILLVVQLVFSQLLQRNK